MGQSTALPVSTAPPAARNERTIGTILVHAGRLTPDGAERILSLQRSRGMRFGDAAIHLGLLSAADIELALARQFDYPYLVAGESLVSDQVISAYAPFGMQARAISALRGELLLRWFDGGATRKALAIVSAERGEGRSFIAANLAVSFSQLGRRTLLIDADMHHPVQHTLFGIDNRNGLSAILSGRGAPETATHRVPGLPGLSLLTAGVQPPNPLELLARPLFPQMLADQARDFDVMLLDSPAIVDHADTQSIAAHAGATLMIARNGRTRVSRIRAAADAVAYSSTMAVGTVLNDF